MHFKLSAIPLVFWAIRLDVAKMLAHRPQPTAPEAGLNQKSPLLESLPAEEIANLLECVLIKRQPETPESESGALPPPFYEAAPDCSHPKRP